jgi:hypothetical protein
MAEVPAALTNVFPFPVLVTVTAAVAVLLMVIKPEPVLVALNTPPLLTMEIPPEPD